MLEPTRADMSLSAFWNAATISVSESRAAESVLLVMKSICDCRPASPVVRAEASAVSAACSAVMSPSLAVI